MESTRVMLDVSTTKGNRAGAADRGQQRSWSRPATVCVMQLPKAEGLDVVRGCALGL